MLVGYLISSINQGVGETGQDYPHFDPFSDGYSLTLSGREIKPFPISENGLIPTQASLCFKFLNKKLIKISQERYILILFLKIAHVSWMMTGF